MLRSHRLHKTVSHKIIYRIIALVQVIVMAMIAVPACCYELEPDHKKTSFSQNVNAIDAGHDKCPCCPDENEADSENCSTCSYCSYYVPLTPTISTNYYPSAGRLISREQFTKLPEVNIPIFVPPQNLA
jgi:hypothetical protein